MTRGILLLLATLIIGGSAQAATPSSTYQAPATPALATDDGDDDDDDWGFWWEAGVNLASNYLWRGYDQSYTGNMFDPSFQPSVTLGVGKFYIDLWLNVSPLSKYHELDMTLGFEHEDLSITLYDVYCGEFNTPFFAGENHSLTATIEYTFFDRLRLHWGTTFLHSADWIEKEDGSKRRAFSSYFEVAYTQPVKELFDIEIAAGASPWTAPFWCAGPRVMQEAGSYLLDFDNLPKGFNVTNLSLMLTRDFEVGAATIPVNVGYVYNPTTNRHYALIKTGFSF